MNKHDWFLFYLLSAFVFGCCLFLVGFFPVDFQKTGLSPSPEPPTKLNGLSLTRPKKQYSNVVFMVVDALRYDFVDKEQMPYTSRHCKVQMKASIPTVTLPRIKSLTSGTISNFIDVILNLGSSQPLQDSILHKLHKRGDKVVFYGDFTWVDLFSKIFHRYESNTDSFYLTEFHEGDNNITKSLHKELRNLTSWDFLILHYIGLDRIGHMEGSNGAKIFLKLREMDDVVELIDKALAKKVTEPKPLLLVTADHGMRNGGGHGGSSPEEIFVPLIVTGRNCSKQDKTTIEYNQVDIAATLSILLDVPIPSTSIGCIIPELIETLTPEEKLYALYYNTKFLIDKAMAKYGKNNVQKEDYYSWYETATDAHTVYLTNILKENTTSAYLFEKAKLNYMRSAYEISHIFAKSYTRFDFGMIFLGVTLTGLSTVLVFLTCFTSTNFSKKLHEPLIYFGRIFLAAASINTIGYVFHYVHTSNIVLMCLTTIPIFVIILLSLELSKLVLRSRLIFTLDIPISIAFGILFQIFSLCSTSFIEEEHQTWYYLGSTFLLSLFWKNISNTRLKVITFSSSSSLERDILIFFKILSPLTKPFLAVLLTVFIRRLNQTGDKWMRIPDIGDWFAVSDNKIYLSLFLVVSLLLIIYQLKQYNTPLQMVACIITCVSIYSYRGIIDAVVFFHPKHFNPFLVLPFYWTSVIYILASSYLPVIFGSTKDNNLDNSRLCKLLGTNLTVFTLISALLHKPHNVFLVFAMHIILKCTYSLCDNLRGARRRLDAQMILLYKVVVTIYVCKMFYFFQGNSNSLATIDLNPGFIGLSHYNPLFVGIMVTANTYFADIFGFLYLILDIYQKQDEVSISKETNEFVNDVSERNNYNLVTTIMATIKLLTTSVYLILMIAFRHHLFIFTVFSPKVLYECFAILLFYLNFSMTNLYFYLLHKII
ncbi:GPI ethanolamine phosphate transferase 2 isoform X2 [Episyrphus balteatus]|uniref:GPI ethanolamine phosphate transferase 2 isoform X2 n=1 Tax=Episyrphus balteatus TaxID=286459 RepID=UPI002485EEE9|nr:GPI ethanolamine phosphate transferase 2 isoform X2 [Episyrphus balteatus]